MRYPFRRYFLLGLTMTAAIVISCGRKDKETKPGQTAVQTAHPAGTPGQKTSAEIYTLDLNPCRDVLKMAGFQSVAYRSFPISKVGDGGEMVVYQAAGAARGGVIYLKTLNGQVAPSWHWYFNDAAPDSVYPVDINEDGLWDMRVVMAGGQVREFIQDQTFTLGGGLRNDWIALNGSSSPPTDSDHSMWKCFDEDPFTFWRSSLAGRDGAFLEVTTPLGLQRGVLTIQTLDEERPKECRLFFDGKEIQSFTLKNETARQRIQIKSSALTVQTARLVILSAHGSGQDVAVAEFSLE